MHQDRTAICCSLVYVDPTLPLLPQFLDLLQRAAGAVAVGGHGPVAGDGEAAHGEGAGPDGRASGGGRRGCVGGSGVEQRVKQSDGPPVGSGGPFVFRTAEPGGRRAGSAVAGIGASLLLRQPVARAAAELPLKDTGQSGGAPVTDQRSHGL